MQVVGTDVIPVLYSEYGNEIRHYSTIRTSLTTFLITVSLSAFSTYFSPGNRSAYLVAAGYIFSLAAICADLYFSYRSSAAIIRYKRIRAALPRVSQASSDVEIDWELKHRAIAVKMARDPMNWLLVAGDLALTGCFLFAKELGGLLSCLHLMR